MATTRRKRVVAEIPKNVWLYPNAGYYEEWFLCFPPLKGAYPEAIPAPQSYIIRLERIFLESKSTISIITELGKDLGFPIGTKITLTGIKHSNM